MTAAVAFDFDNVVPTVQRAHSRATREDAEDAVMTAVAEGIEKGWDLTARNVIACARFRLLTMKERREAHNVSLDEAMESDVDSAPVELAVEEIDFEAHATLAEAASHPVRSKRLELIQSGAPSRLMRRGAASRLARYPDEEVELARQLRKAGRSFPEIAAVVAAPQKTIEVWCRRASRVTPATLGWTRELMVEAMQHFEREEGRRPVEKDLRGDSRLPTIETTRRLFGRWGAALEAAGMPYSPPPPKWDRETALAAFREAAGRLGRFPSHTELRARGSGLPSYGVIERLFGTTSLERIREIAEAAHG